MNMKSVKNIQAAVVAIVLLLIVVLSRALPHPPNFTPVGAMALFGGAIWAGKKYMWLLPLGIYWLSDLFMNNVVYAHYYDSFQWFGNPMVYLALACILIVGMRFMRHRTPGRRWLYAIPAGLGVSLIFYFLTNAGAWYVDPMYPKTMLGLSAAYIAGIEFFWNTLASTILFSAVFFYAWDKLSIPEWDRESQTTAS